MRLVKVLLQGLLKYSPAPKPSSNVIHDGEVGAESRFREVGLHDALCRVKAPHLPPKQNPKQLTLRDYNQLGVVKPKRFCEITVAEKWV